jgi:hypothetical protein
MNLHLLRTAPGICVYYDTCNDWLFIEWEGELTLRTVQLASLELATCILQRPYARVLNSNLLATSISWDMAPWLACEVLPYLRLAGIDHLAWVRPQALRGQYMVNALMSRLPGLAVALFDEMDHAVTWLTRHRPPATTSGAAPMHSPATQARLHELIQTMTSKLLP